MKERDLKDLIHRAEALLGRVEAWLDPRPATDWSALAYRWRRAQSAMAGTLQPITRIAPLRAEQLGGVEDQTQALLRNTEQFVRGLPANNVLLWGARGTGKSSLIKALLPRFGKRGLRLIEVERDQLLDLPDILDLIADRQERFVIFCDDLAFGAAESGYRALKAALEGSVAATPENVLIYATSNRRHLLPEHMADNLEARFQGGELHEGEAVEEKISLAERFGLRLSFYAFDQATYLQLVARWLAHYGIDSPQADWEKPALRWATQNGGRSGRAAHQFARDRAGRLRLDRAGRGDIGP